METLTTSKTVSVKIYLPEETRAKFKASCAMRSLSMNEVLLEYIETWLQENEAVLEPKPQRVKTIAKTEETD
ncbi:plasmid partition protein ParG [Microcoleus sp. B9-D4]|uniref:plasmid partition protein ParG n=1 Tax=Microcoleus sp. B9-D4 TaxID=2818711 RepID=UPI002FD2B722